MANIKSAIKRIQIAERNRLSNKAYKSAVKTLSKRFLVSVNAHSSEPSSESIQVVQANLAAAYSKIDKAVKRGVLHPNTAARKKSGLARVLKQHTTAS